jgi:hypothetical protein
MEAVLDGLLFCFNSQKIVVRVLLMAFSVFSVPIVSFSHYTAYAHPTVDGGAIVKTIDSKY